MTVDTLAVRKTTRAPRPAAKQYPWVGTPLGLVAKAVIYRIGVAEAGDLLHRLPSAATLFARFCEVAPWMAEEYESVTGNALTPNIVYNRLHKMVYVPGGGADGGAASGRRLSTEHPCNLETNLGLVHGLLRLRIDECVRLGVPIPIDLAREWGTAPTLLRSLR